MLINKRISAGRLIVPFLFAVSTLLFGCSSMKEAEMLHQNDQLKEINRELATELAEENSVVASLQMKLVEKQAEIDKIKFTQEHLTQEIANTKARMPTPKTKVEVVTYLAEVEADIKAAKELSSDSEQQNFLQVDQFMAESKVEFERGNYDTALSRASQALELTHIIQIKTALNRRLDEGTYAEFILPLHLHLAKRSNIRKTPTIQGKIIMILPPRTLVTAIGYQGDWIKIAIENGQKGWIHYSLLAVPETTLTFPQPVK